MRFSSVVVAVLSAPLCVDGSSKNDEAMEAVNVASSESNLSTTSMPNDETMPSLSVDEGGVAPNDLDADASNEEASWAQASELRNPENQIEQASGDENVDDLTVDIGMLSTERKLSPECESYPVVRRTTPLHFRKLVKSCYSGSSNLDDCPDVLKVDLHCWDTSLLTDLSGAFWNMQNFNDDISSWDTGKVTTLEETFVGATSFNSDISSWDTSSVTTLRKTFHGASSFNSDLSSWDTTNVNSLEWTFRSASSFNSDISSWNTGKVTTLYQTFFSASKFNSDISSWDTSNVKNMRFTFFGTDMFNSDISAWNTAKVTSLGGTFSRAWSFNSDISSWDTGNVWDMATTFSRTSNFNQDISSWDVRNVRMFSNMFYRATAFNQCLGSWAPRITYNPIDKDIFRGSGCPHRSDPDPENGPWCQGFEHRCFGSCVDAEEFRFGKNRKPCDSINDIKAPTEERLKEKLNRVCRKQAFSDDESIRVRHVCQEACGRRGFAPGKRCEHLSV